jgi:polyhydroxybutyrate depolymerase
MKNFNLLIFLLLLGQNLLFAQHQLEVGGFEFEGRFRSYEVYLPHNFHANMPVVFTIHGYTESLSVIKKESKMHEAADSMGFITVYPKSASIGWNNGESEPECCPWPMYDTTVNDIGFISALIDTIDIHHDVDLNRIYVCGYASGGEMAFRLITELGHRFAAAASVSGPLNDVIASVKPIRSFPILQMHGTSDSYLPYSNPDGNRWSVEKTLNFWVENNGCLLPADTVQLFDNIFRISYINCNDDNIVVHYQFRGGGHEWPSLPVNASVEILNFFKGYTNPLLNHLAFGKSLKISHKFFPQEGATLVVNAELTNPQNHPITAYAHIRGIYTGFKDSVELFDDGLHNDGSASDNIWGATKWLSGLEEDFFVVEGYTKDMTEDLTLIIPAKGYFTTASPLELDSVSFKKDTHGKDFYNLTSFVRNAGNSLTIAGATVRLDCEDPWVFAINSYYTELPEMAPGETVESISPVVLSYIDSLLPRPNPYFNIKARITVHRWATWTDSTVIIDDIEDEILIPINYSLSQNYPNPFNPTTKINYSIPKRSNIVIIVYDILGKEVTTLVNEEKLAGTYEVEFNSHSGEVRNLPSDRQGLPSGVYFYQLRAGSFVETKKMLLLK